MAARVNVPCRHGKRRAGMGRDVQAVERSGKRGSVSVEGVGPGHRLLGKR